MIHRGGRLAIGCLAAVLSRAVPALAVDLRMVAGTQPNDAVFAALAAELGRARDSLRIDPNPAAYFTAASVSDMDAAEVRASFGAITRTSESHDRGLDVAVRVGDWMHDSSRFVRRGFPSFRRSEITTEDDVRELRRAVWLSLDDAYKDALEDLARKKAVLDSQMRSSGDTLPDFTREEPGSVVAPPPATVFRRAEWEARARRLSGILRRFPEIQSSTVAIFCSRRTVHYLDTDGRLALHGRMLWGLEASAETQASDGMPLRDFVSFYARRPEEAPAEQVLADAIEAMARRITVRRAASALQENASGPLLLEDQAAAEFLLALAGQSAAVQREPITEARAAVPASPWKGRLGTRVTADFFDMSDDPSRNEFHGMSLVGSYAMDDEAVPPRAVNLVEKGILRAVLGTRTPVPGAARSNGHARSLPGAFSEGPLQRARPAPGVFVVTARNDKPVSPEEVRARFRDLLRERGLQYGYVVRRIQNAAASPSRRDDSSTIQFVSTSGASRVAAPLEVLRVSADGTEVPLRGATWDNLDARALKDVVLASSGEVGEAAFNLRAIPGSTGAGSSGPVPMSVICPRAVLLDDAELAPVSGPFATPPELPHPFFARAGK